MSEQFAIGTIVVTRIEHPGDEHNGTTHGHLPAGARGVVSHYTEDGRAVIDFPGFDAHSWHESALPFVVEVVPDELARLRAENERLVADLEATAETIPASERCYICLWRRAISDGMCISCMAVHRLRAELARLRAELAAANERVAQLEVGQDWEPFDDWIIDCDCPESCGAKLYADDGMLQIEDAEGSVMTIHLPDNVRLQRRRPQEVES